MLEQFCYALCITNEEVIWLIEELSAVPWALIAPLLVIQFILLIVALIDLRRVHATNGPKVLWVFIILFVSLFGPIAYFIVGRKQS